VTDADIVLGYLNPDFFLGGKMALDRAGAERAIDEQIARPLGLSVVEAAAGIYKIACSHSADLIRKVSIERGHDPRDFIIFAYGGAGPVHAGLYAQHLGSAQVLVPFTASVHCAMGAVCADVVREYGLSDPMRFPPDAARVNANFARLEQKAREELRADGFEDENIKLRRFLDLKFRRQVHVVRMPLKDGTLTAEDLERLNDEFEETYERRYGKGSAFRAAGTEITTFSVQGTGEVAKPELRKQSRTTQVPADARAGTRTAYFVDAEDPAAPPQAAETPLYRLPGLVAGNEITGPAIIETPVTTIVVQPGQRASVDEYLNVLIAVGATPEAPA
jgi:N-methylhydantoinase A